MARIRIFVTQVGTQHRVKNETLRSRHVDSNSREVSLTRWRSFLSSVAFER